MVNTSIYEVYAGGTNSKMYCNGGTFGGDNVKIIYYKKNIKYTSFTKYFILVRTYA